MVRDMCTEANIDGRYTNHSLRATGASELFQSETPEHVIQQFTGHWSVQALHQYENISTKQKQAACNILQAHLDKDLALKYRKLLGCSNSVPYSNAFTMPTIS